MHLVDDWLSSPQMMVGCRSECRVKEAINHRVIGAQILLRCLNKYPPDLELALVVL